MSYRRNGYWYRSRREGRRVATDYLGRGPGAEAEVARDREETRAREARREAERRERQEAEAGDAPVDLVLDRTDELLRAVLLASGYRTHKGVWRRHGDDDGATAGSAGATGAE